MPLVHFEKLVLKNLSATARGEVHGEKYRKEIHELVDIRRTLIRKYLPRWDETKINELAMKQARALSRVPEIEAEFIGIAKGANISLEDLAVLNNYTDMRDFDPDEDVKMDAGGCSVLAVKTAKGTFCGQTWDMHASARDYLLVLEIENENAPKQWVLTVAGCLALAGVNSHGLSILINNLHSRETSDGLQWPALVRKMLLEKSAQAALTTMKQFPPASGHNYLLVDENTLLNVETTGRDFEVTTQNQNICYHTNHYISRLSKHEITSRVSGSTKPRLERIEKFLGASFDPLSIPSEVFSHRGKSTVAVPRPSSLSGSMTCGGMWIDYPKHEILFFRDSYSEGEEIRASLG